MSTTPCKDAYDTFSQFNTAGGVLNFRFSRDLVDSSFQLNLNLLNGWIEYLSTTSPRTPRWQILPPPFSTSSKPCPPARRDPEDKEGTKVNEVVVVVLVVLVVMDLKWSFKPFWLASLGLQVWGKPGWPSPRELSGRPMPQSGRWSIIMTLIWAHQSNCPSCFPSNVSINQGLYVYFHLTFH